MNRITISSLDATPRQRTPATLRNCVELESEVYILFDRRHNNTVQYFNLGVLISRGITVLWVPAGVKLKFKNGEIIS